MCTTKKNEKFFLFIISYLQMNYLYKHKIHIKKGSKIVINVILMSYFMYQKARWFIFSIALVT